MRRLTFTLIVPAALFVAAACAATAGAATYRTTAGSATPHDIARFASRILDRYQFDVQRADTSPHYLVIETRWRGRYPLADEIAGGVVEALTRLTIQARARNRSAAPGQDLRLVQITAENMVRLADSTDWVRGYMTPMFKAYIDEFVGELKTELHTGVRVF